MTSPALENFGNGLENIFLRREMIIYFDVHLRTDTQEVDIY
jgi:hypothetical protein